MNSLGGTGLWSEQVGFYTDQIHASGRVIPLELRAAVGLIPLFAVEVLEEESMRRLASFSKRTRWFLRNRPDLARHIAYLESGEQEHDVHRLLAIPSRERLERVLRYLLDEREFLAPYGVRSLSRVYEANPYKVRYDHQEFSVRYAPAESETQLFGSNSNWRGPVWFPLNFLIIEALERYHHFYGDAFRVECPVGSGRMLTLAEVARDLQSRLARIFLPGPDGRRPCHGTNTRYATDPDWKDLVLFYEFFDGETGRGCGASHQTGWTALVVRCIEDLARCRTSSIEHRDSRLGTTADRG
jgi:hypothetical protein